jgi:hypothetical protein
MYIESLTHSINQIRYLFVWRVTHSLIRTPSYLPLELSSILGQMICERLPTKKARPWRKCLSPWHDYEKKMKEALRTRNRKAMPAVPDVSWPLDVVLFAYPSKRTFGQDELIFWELKLLGGSASHSLFLEQILPAIEEASLTSDSRWRRSNRLWGRFDIEGIYVARGAQWEPLSREGRLDLSLRVTPTQWAERLTFGLDSMRAFTQLNWVTPFELTLEDERQYWENKPSACEQDFAMPTLSDILNALMSRVASIIASQPTSAKEGWDLLTSQQQEVVQEVMEQTSQFFVPHEGLTLAPRGWPGHLMGTQYFTGIPPLLIPFLELASILHIGKYTHLGCGTFTLS